MASQAQRDHVSRIREDVAKNPEKYTSRRILSSVDRSRGTTRQDITDQAIAARDAEAPQVEPGTMGGDQVVEPAHTGLSNPALSNHHLSSPLNPFIHSRPTSDLNVRTATIQESIEQAKDRRTPEYTPEELTVRSQMVGGGSETLMYSPDQRADLMESIHQKSPNSIANKINEDQLSGATKNADISAFSVRYYEGAKGISDTIKAGIPELKERTGAAGVVLEYPVKSFAGFQEMIGMVPGGLEVLKENPGAIMPALAVGAYQSSYGTVKAFEENPLQVTSDFATVALFGYGLSRGVGSARVGLKNTKANLDLNYQNFMNERALIKMRNKDPFKQTGPVTEGVQNVKFDLEVLKLKTQNKYNNARYDLEVKRLQAQENIGSSINKLMVNDAAQLQLLKPVVKEVKASRPIRHSSSSDVLPTLESQLSGKSKIPSLQEQLSAKSGLSPKMKAGQSPLVDAAPFVGLSFSPSLYQYQPIASEQDSLFSSMVDIMPAVSQTHATAISHIPLQSHKQKQKQAVRDDPLRTTTTRPPILEPPEFKFLTIPKSTPRSKSKSKRSQDPLDLLNKNLYNKYNDPLKVGASIDAGVKKLLGGL